MSESAATPQARINVRAARNYEGLRRTIIIAALTSLGYYLTAKLGFAFALQPGSVSTLWIPNSLLLAALLLVPQRFWWLIILAAFPAHVAAELQSGVPAGMVLSWFVSNSSQALIGAITLNYFVTGELRFDSFRHVLLFLFFGAFLAPVLSSFIDIAFVRVNTVAHGPYWDIWRIRFLSNVLSTLIVVPAVLTWVHGGVLAARNAPPLTLVEAALLTGSLIVVSMHVFSNTEPNLYWTVPFLLWAAVRFGPCGVATLLLLVMFMAIYGATNGHGPFVGDSPADKAIAVQSFLIVISVTLMSLGAVIAERRDAQEVLRQNIVDRQAAEQALLQSSARNQAILRALPDMMFLHTKDGVYLDYYTRDPQSLLLSPESFIGKNFRDVLPAEVAGKIEKCLERLGPDETQVLEYSLKIGDTQRYFEARMVTAEGSNVLSIVRDVTGDRRAADALRRGEERLLESNRSVRELAARLITAQEQERRRISLLLHDDVGQNLAALGVSISRLKRKVPDLSRELRAEFDNVAQQTNDLTTQLRHLSHQLHPEVLEHVGLVAALESQVSEFGHEEQIEARFITDVKTQPVPLDVSLGLYRVAIEAMRNVSRHSGAKAATISLREADGILTLEVSDSGRGFDVEKAKRGSGIGLASAEERVKLLQGVFEIRSEPDAGTSVLVRIPLTRRT